MFASLYNSRSRPYLNRILAAEISSLTRYYDALYQVEPRSQDNGSLFLEIDCPKKEKKAAWAELPNMHADLERRSVILLNGNFNHHFDVQELLLGVKSKLGRTGRVVAVVYNSYLRGLYTWANRLGIRKGELPTTFFTQRDLENIAKISGFEVVRSRPVGYCPLSLFGLGTLLNKIFQAMPVLRWFGFAQVLVLRPVHPSAKRPSLSIVIPARNEAGNIENALKRMPNLGAPLEILFVEGNSTDNTWDEIQRVAKAYAGQFQIKTLKQPGKGKNDAVRAGFAVATGDLLTILDADLTMPPELLGRFYEAYVQGQADFVNGSRLVYPMEGEAMRFLNWLGNNFFAKALSWVLDTPLGDSLCGTKLVSRDDYARIKRWRGDFGDFDPFGDFELLFPAAILGLGIVDIPIRYRARTYGTTNIHRFRHGFILLKMTLIGLFRIRMGRTSTGS